MDNIDESVWFKDRLNPHVKPLYKIIARSMSLGGDSIATIHKAGTDYVENYYIRELVNNNEIMNNLSEKEADLLRWVVNSEVTDPLKN